MGAEEAAVELIKARASYEAAFPRREVDNAPNLWGLPWGSNTTQGPIEERTFPCIVEASKGSTLKYAVDAEYGVLRCEGVLVTAIFWPANFGLIPQTISEKGKPVSVMILSTAPLENRSSVEIRVVGAAECIDELGPEMKVVGVPKSEPRMREWNSIEVLPFRAVDLRRRNGEVHPTGTSEIFLPRRSHESHGEEAERFGGGEPKAQGSLVSAGDQMKLQKIQFLTYPTNDL